MHAKLAVEMFNEGLRDDIAQSSEKLYKAVKALAIAKGLDEAREALEKGGWTVNLLDRAARRFGPRLTSYTLMASTRLGLTITGVRDRVPIIEALIREVRRLLSQ